MSVVVVLTWDGEVSAVSQDAVQDSRVARTATVIDDWDEEVDCGKVRCVTVTRAGHVRQLGRGPGPGAPDLAGPCEVAGSVVKWSRARLDPEAQVQRCVAALNVVWLWARRRSPAASVPSAVKWGASHRPREE